MTKAVQNLDENARRLLIRIDDARLKNQRLEGARNHSSRLSAFVHQQVVDAGFLGYERSPKGRKSWYRLTEAGIAAMPEIRRMAAERLADLERQHATRVAERRGKWHERAQEAVDAGADVAAIMAAMQWAHEQPEGLN